MRQSGHHSEWKPLLVHERERHADCGIYSQEQLRRLIQYERARADRSGSPLSLILCATGDRHSHSHRQLAGAVSMLERSIRTTDHLGWYDRSHLGVVLPGTTHVGAAQLVETLRVQDGSLRYTIHSYPDEWLEHQHHATCESAEPESQTHCFVSPLPLWKRITDLFVSAPALLLLSPVLGVIALWIKLVSPGPVLFRQRRVGRERNEFEFLKFRTMHCDNSATEHSSHLKSLIRSDQPMRKLDRVDPRIIPGGRLIRKLSMDELPQLVNVLRGEMSIVGPRPCIPYEAEEYLQWHAGRFALLPGLTGLWQVSGKNRLTFQQMIRYDIEYQHRVSFWFDMAIILRTVPTLVQLSLEGIGRRESEGDRSSSDQSDVAVS